MPDVIFLAYVAGFFDGEGCIGVYWQKHKNSKHGGRYYLQVQLAQKKQCPVLAECRDRWGGYLKKGRLWRWVVTANKARAFLEDLLPYLRVKREQAIVAIEFRKSIKRWGVDGVPSDVLEWQRGISDKLKLMKREGYGE